MTNISFSSITIHGCILSDGSSQAKVVAVQLHKYRDHIIIRCIKSNGLQKVQYKVKAATIDQTHQAKLISVNTTTHEQGSNTIVDTVAEYMLDAMPTFSIFQHHIMTVKGVIRKNDLSV